MFALDVRILLFLLFGNTVVGSASTTFSAPSTVSTCPSRTINYLTHTLHQQCLPSSRSATWNSTINSNSTITSIALSARTTDLDLEQATTRQVEIEKEQSKPISEPSPAAPPPRTFVQTPATSRATARVGTVAVSQLPDPIEDESPLESGNFLSFEDWKKQNLIKAGQSEHLGRQDGPEHREPRKRPPNMHDALDSLGDDAEIDLDFSGLVPIGPDTTAEELARKVNEQNAELAAAENESKPKARARSKDAGTTCKERSNYASFDCAASVLKSNRETKSAQAILIENKDSYMLNQCSAKEKFLILELCDYISIDTIVLANFEFFSSIFRTFRVSVSDKYPVKLDRWKPLGSFEARNTRDIQAFLVENPVIWAKYVKIDFLTHYGNEFYCPVSLVRVHGTTMMEEYRHDLEASMGEDDESDVDSEADAAPGERLVPEAIAQVLLIEQRHDETKEIPTVKQSIPIGYSTQDVSLNSSILSHETSPNTAFVANYSLSVPDNQVCQVDEVTSQEVYAAKTEIVTDQSECAVHPTQPVSTATILKSAAVKPGDHPTQDTLLSNTSPGPNITTHKTSEHTANNQVSEAVGRKSSSTTTEQAKTQALNKDAIRSSPARQPPSVVQSPPASPTMQESFFKSVQKRIQMLESNSSLSLQYIEEQSRALRDAFHKVEQRQLSKTSNFLDHLNRTVLSELREFRQQYDQLWQSTVIELELQRERYQYESQAMHARLGVLADELIFQKRVSIFQTVLIVVCLALVLFSRGVLNTYLELPLLQSVLARSPNAKWIAVPGESQTNSPQVVRTRPAHQVGVKQGILKTHRRGVSEDSNTDTLSPSELYSPPTPVSFDGFSDSESIKVESKLENPEFDPGTIKRPSTSPPMLSGGEDPTTPTRNMNTFSDATIEHILASPNSSPSPECPIPQVRVRQPSPAGKHLKWDLPKQ